MTAHVFVSAGRAATKQQEDFINEVEGLMRDQGLNPRGVGRTDFGVDQPLKLIEKVMGECAGVVIIAFERIHIEQGTELRGSPKPRDVGGQRIPTVWNHIEAAMGYVTRRPLLVIVEDGLRPEGLLEVGYDWYVQRVELSSATLKTAEFKGIFSDWKRRVENVNGALARGEPLGAPMELDITKLTVGRLLKEMTPSQLWGTLAAAFAVIGAVAAGAYWLGTKLPS